MELSMPTCQSFRTQARFLWNVVPLLMGMVLFSGGTTIGSAEDDAATSADARQPRPAGETLYVEDLPPELERVLQEWERHSKRIRTLEGKHRRYLYNHTFQDEKRAEGQFFFQAPDRGRIDIVPLKVTETVNPRKIGKNGQPFTITADRPERWICTGKEVLEINDAEKSFDLFPLPPDVQGENIIESPLPFLFGMEAEAAKRRYKLSLGSLHDPEGKRSGIRRIHVVALPRLRKDRANWSRAEVLLDAETYLPQFIRLFDPAGTLETVYQFYNVRVNKPWKGFLGIQSDPFHPALRGYRPIPHQPPGDASTVEHPKPPAGGVKPVVGEKEPRAPRNGGNTNPNAVRVPSLIGLHYKDIERIVKQRGLVARYRRGEPAANAKLVYVAYRQQPAAGTEVAKGEAVVLTLYDKMASDSGKPRPRTDGEKR